MSQATLASCLSAGVSHTFYYQHHSWVTAGSVTYDLCEDVGEIESHLLHESLALPNFHVSSNLNPTYCSDQGLCPESRVSHSQEFFGSSGSDPGFHTESHLPYVMLCILLKSEVILY